MEKTLPALHYGSYSDDMRDKAVLVGGGGGGVGTFVVLHQLINLC